MKFFFKYCALFFFASVSVFSQGVSREQGLITSDPYWRQALGGAVLSLPSFRRSQRLSPLTAEASGHILLRESRCGTIRQKGK